MIDNDSFLSTTDGLPAIEIYKTISGKDPLQCPICKQGKMIIMAENPKVSKPPG
jgi:hypothetical protein